MFTGLMSSKHKDTSRHEETTRKDSNNAAFSHIHDAMTVLQNKLKEKMQSSCAARAPGPPKPPQNRGGREGLGAAA